MSAAPACSLEAAVTASENPVFRDVLDNVYRQAYGPRGLEVCEIQAVPRHLQSESVDYLVTLANPETGHGLQEYCELKTERHCYGRITVEEWSVYEAGIAGWPWKQPGEIVHQRLCTVWRDGAVYFPYLSDYQNWLARNRDALLTKVAEGHPDYKRIKATSIGYGKGYTSYAFTMPIALLRRDFGHCWYQLEGVSLKLAQDGIDGITAVVKPRGAGGAP